MNIFRNKIMGLFLSFSLLSNCVVFSNTTVKNGVSDAGIQQMVEQIIANHQISAMIAGTGLGALFTSILMYLLVIKKKNEKKLEVYNLGAYDTRAVKVKPKNDEEIIKGFLDTVLKNYNDQINNEDIESSKSDCFVEAFIFVIQGYESNLSKIFKDFEEELKINKKYKEALVDIKLALQKVNKIKSFDDNDDNNDDEKEIIYDEINNIKDRQKDVIQAVSEIVAAVGLSFDDFKSDVPLYDEIIEYYENEKNYLQNQVVKLKEQKDELESDIEQKKEGLKLLSQSINKKKSNNIDDENKDDIVFVDNEIDYIQQLVHDYQLALKELEQMRSLVEENQIYNVNCYDDDSNIDIFYGTSMRVGTINKIELGDLSFYEDKVICSSVHFGINKHVDGIDGANIITYAHADLNNLNMSEVACDYIVIPVADQSLFSLKEIQNSIDAFVNCELKNNAQRIIKVVYLLNENSDEDDFIQAKKFLNIYNEDKFATKNIFRIIALGDNNLNYACKFIKKCNGYISKNNSYVDTNSMIDLSDTALIMYGVDTSNVGFLLNQVDSIVNQKSGKKNLIGKILNMYGVGTSRTNRKIGEGIESVVKYIDCKVVFKDSKINNNLEDRLVIKYGLYMLADQSSFINRECGVYTNYLYMIEQKQNNIFTRKIGIRDYDQQKSVNIGMAQFITENVNNYTFHKRIDLMKKMKEEDENIDSNDICQQINNFSYDTVNEVVDKTEKMIEFADYYTGASDYCNQTMNGVFTWWNNRKEKQNYLNENNRYNQNKYSYQN